MSVVIKKVLISDNVDKKCQDLLKANQIEVVSKTGLSDSELIAALEGCQGLIVRSDTKVKQNIIEKTESLKVIGRAGTGVDNIDTAAATKKGIIVLNAPNGNSISACELSCSLITCLARNVTGGCQSMKEGKWDRKAFAGGSELMGKTLAIIGLGRIGKEVAYRMKSFGMQIIGFDPFLSAEEASKYSITRLELEEIWPVADYITVHTPLIPQTRNLVNKSVFEKCKPGVKIVNAARGGIINEEDLLSALESGKCGGAALDVFSEEPPTSPVLRKLISHPKVIATPHIGASTKEAQTRVAVEVAEQFISLNNQASEYEITGVLNAPALLASRQSENTAWLDLAEQLGRVVGRIGRGKYPLTGAKVKITLEGPDICQMKFLSTSVLLGILSGNQKNGYNLINSPLYAEEAGLKVAIDGMSTAKFERNIQNVVKISVNNESSPPLDVEGTIVDSIPVLLAVNDAHFPAAIAQLTNDVQIYGTDTNNTQAAIGAVISANQRISNLAVAYGSKHTWIIVSADTKEPSAALPTNVYSY